MIYLIPNKRGYMVKIALMGRTYCRFQRKQYAAALSVVSELEKMFPNAGVAILADFGQG